MDLDIATKFFRVLIVVTSSLDIRELAAYQRSYDFPAMNEEEFFKSDNSMDRCHRNKNFKKIWRPVSKPNVSSVKLHLQQV
jgi:hypothetical protein